MKREVMGAIICLSVSLLAVVGLIKAAPVIEHSLEQMQTYDCLTRPLDTSGKSQAHI